MRTLSGTLLASLLALAACGEKKEDAAQVLCDLLFECECDPNPYTDVAACVTAQDMRFDAQVTAAKATADANGLTFDQGCADRSRQIENPGCNFENVDPSACSFCAIAHGDKPVGASCSLFDGHSDCAGNLSCFDGVCSDPCFEGLPAGSTCDPEPGEDECADGLYCSADGKCTLLPTSGQPCTNFGQCAEDLACSSADNTCKTLPGNGQPCPDLLCAADLVCDPVETTCKVLPGEGQPCDFFCAEYLYCEAGTCVPGPGEGEPCPDAGVCGRDLECDFDSNTCVAIPAAICLFSDN